MGKKKSNEEFVKEVYDLVGDEYVFLEKYIDAKTKIKCKHNICGYEWYILPNNFLRGKRCPKCAIFRVSKANSFTYKKVKQYVEVESNSGCKLLSKEYKNNTTKMLFQCKCGNIFKTTFAKFKDRNKRQCNICGQKKLTELQITPKEKFIEELKSIHGDEYEIIGKYKNKHTKVLIRHKICGYEWEAIPQNLTGNRSKKPTTCPECSKSRKDYTIDDIKIKLYSINPNIEVLSKEYINCNSELKCKCLLDNYIWTTYWEALRSGAGCPKCSIPQKPKSEKIVAAILDKYNINYITQKTFKDCKYKNKLSFDFYLPDYNLCIETDGKQHFEPIEWFGGEKHFKDTQIRDQIKNQYCKDHNIPLLRIPYWEFDNIENILEEWLKKYIEEDLKVS